MKKSQDVIHTPKSPREEDVCLACGHPSHDGGTCEHRGCLCGKCIRNEDELEEPVNNYKPL